MSDSKEDIVLLCSLLGVGAVTTGVGKFNGASLVDIDPDARSAGNEKALLDIELPSGKHLILTAEIRDDWTTIESLSRTNRVMSQLPEELFEAVKDAELRHQDIRETIKNFKKPRN